MLVIKLVYTIDFYYWSFFEVMILLLSPMRGSVINNFQVPRVKAFRAGGISRLPRVCPNLVLYIELLYIVFAGLLEWMNAIMNHILMYCLCGFVLFFCNGRFWLLIYWWFKYHRAIGNAHWDELAVCILHIYS